MAICRAADQGTGGFTLFEMLVAMAVAALMVTLVSASFAGRINTVRLDRSATQLVEDLSRARLDARMSGETVRVEVTETGYRVLGPGLHQLDRVWPDGVESRWRQAVDRGYRPVWDVAFAPERLAGLDAVEIELERGSWERTIRVEALTQRVVNDRG